jgi:trimeric autotransporter adhesin
MKTILLGNLMRRATLPGVLPALRAFLICLILLSIAQAVNPPPGGGYPGQNTAAGTDALFRLTDGIGNTALGSGALRNDTDGHSNTAVGAGALENNRRGNQNTATGLVALVSSSFDNGPDNTAYGYRALDETSGDRNTAIGWNALHTILEGTDNIVLGGSAGRNLFRSDSFNIDIGNIGVRGDNRVVRIGDTDQVRTFIAGVSGSTVTGGLAVRVNATGQLGIAPSSERFKDDIKPIGKTSEAIFALKPVTFRYKKGIDPNGIQQFGLVAEEVEKVNRDLVVRDSGGKPYTVRYDAVNAMLLNEFLKEHRKVATLQSGVAELTARFKAADSRIEKVSEQLELSKSVPQTVLNNQ